MDQPLRRLQRSRPGGRGRRGFSLVELLMTTSVGAVLLALGAPWIQGWVVSQQLTIHANDMLANLHYVRGEAILRNKSVAMCKSPDGATCTADGGWDQGAIIFLDDNTNGVRDAGEPLLHRTAGLGTNYRLTGNTTVRSYISYGPDGTSRTASGAFLAGTLVVCRLSAESGDARQIVIAAGGRPRVQRVRVDACA